MCPSHLDPQPAPALAEEPDSALRFEIPADAWGVRGFLGALATHLEPFDLEEDAFGDAQLVLAEILNNIVEHAFAADEEGLIQLVLRGGHDFLSMRVEDGGREMPGRRLPLGQAQPFDLPRDELPEGGFGWFMIHELVEKVSYDRRDGRNVVQIDMRMG